MPDNGKSQCTVASAHADRAARQAVVAAVAPRLAVAVVVERPPLFFDGKKSLPMPMKSPYGHISSTPGLILFFGAQHPRNIMDFAPCLSSSDMHCVWASNCLTAIYEDLVHTDPRADHAEVVDLMHKTRLQMEVVHTLLLLCDPWAANEELQQKLWYMASNVAELLGEDFGGVRDLWFAPFMDLLAPHLPADICDQWICESVPDASAAAVLSLSVPSKQKVAEDGSIDAELSAAGSPLRGALHAGILRDELSPSFFGEMEQHCQRMEDCERAQQEQWTNQLQELYAATQTECFSREMYQQRYAKLLQFVHLHHRYFFCNYDLLGEPAQYILVRIQKELAAEHASCPQEMTNLKRTLHDMFYDLLVVTQLKSF
jgi:hypothetical protein